MPPGSKATQAESNLLLCYVEGYPEPPDLDAIRQVLALLDQRSEWVVGPPQLVNEGEWEEQTLGVLLILPRTTDPLDVQLERRVLADVEAVVGALEQVTGSAALEIAVELDGVVVGWVENGAADQLLAEGLLAPWRARLEESG